MRAFEAEVDRYVFWKRAQLWGIRAGAGGFLGMFLTLFSPPIASLFFVASLLALGFAAVASRRRSEAYRRAIRALNDTSDLSEFHDRHRYFSAALVR